MPKRQIKMLWSVGLEAFGQLDFDVLQVGNGGLLAVGQRQVPSVTIGFIGLA